MNLWKYMVAVDVLEVFPLTRLSMSGGYMIRTAKWFLGISLTLIVILTFHISTFAASEKALEKAEADVKLQLGDKQKGIIKTIQYTGLTRKENVQSDQVDPWIVSMDSEGQLKEFLTKHHYHLPQIDFADNYVYVVWGIGNPPYLHDQLTKYKVTAVRFDDGKLSNAATSCVLVAGAEKRRDPFTFLIVVIHKSDIKQ